MPEAATSSSAAEGSAYGPSGSGEGASIRTGISTGEDPMDVVTNLTWLAALLTDRRPYCRFTSSLGTTTSVR